MLPAQESLPFNIEPVSDNINVRADSTANSVKVSSVNKDDLLEAVSELYGWYKIRLPKTAPAYVKKELAECISASPDTNACRNAKITKNRVNIRLAPEEGSRILGTLNKDEVISIVSEASGWYKIEPTSGSFGWVYKDLVRKTARKKQQGPQARLTPDENPPIQLKEDKDITVKGIIKPSGKIFRRTTTHKLLSLDGKTFLLKGNKQALDALNHKIAKVEGRLIDSPRHRYPVLEVRVLSLQD